ncbi:MAG TPA: hypothetical protein VLG37_03795, partial [Candidatus Saccharimonadales bacterium]|nr:hypothetical protein [Candidatus Saccharimonadales bacterium]
MLPRLQKQFWNHTLVSICQEMKQQTGLSRRALKDVSILRPDNIIAKLLDKINASIDETLATQADARSFLKHYQQTNSKVKS